MKTPVLFLIFNRPETTFRVFEAIRHYQPEELFIAADGPRPHKAEDAARCEKVRSVASMVDWECKVHTLFRTENLGCKYAVSGAIDWFFSQVEEGIILEDDCLPNDDFFRFCTEMLSRYRNEEQVMHIGGCNFNYGKFFSGESDYSFTVYPHCWGWATWRRAWRSFEKEMGSFPAYVQEKRIREIFPGSPYKQWRFLRIFRKCYEKQPFFTDVWDYPWCYTLFRKNALSITPRRNLVCNIGMENATHTMHRDFCGAELETLPDVLTEPGRMLPDPKLDRQFFARIYKGDWKDWIRYLLSCFTGRDWM